MLLNIHEAILYQHNCVRVGCLSCMSGTDEQFTETPTLLAGGGEGRSWVRYAQVVLPVLQAMMCLTMWCCSPVRPKDHPAGLWGHGRC